MSDDKPDLHQEQLERINAAATKHVVLRAADKLDSIVVTEEPQEIVSGLQFTVVPKFELIPREAMLRLVRRAELGQRTKGKNAWNALSENQDALKSREALAKRLGHAIDHAYKLLDRLATGEPLYDLKSDEDDAAALMWAGMYACCATEAIEAD